MKTKKLQDLKVIGKKISKVDRKLAKILKKRLALAVPVARWKIANGNLPILRPDVEDQRISRFMDVAQEMGMDHNFARAVYWLVICESCRVQIGEKEQ